MNLRDILDKWKRRGEPEVPAADDGKLPEELYELHRPPHNIALESLDDLTADDIAPPPPKEKKSAGDLISNAIRGVILAVSVCVFAGSFFTLVRTLIDKQKADDIYSDIAQNIFESNLGGSGEHAVSLSPSSKALAAMPDYHTGLDEEAWEDLDDGTGESYNIKFQQMKANLTYLRNVNPDIFGYIHIDGTNISYPIVQGDDNDYYLERSYTGDYLVVGSIFADFRAYKNMDYNQNTVFYGHNIDNITSGQMFNNVTKFFDPELFNNALIEIYTFDGIYYYKPFSIHQTVSTFQYFTMHFPTDADFIDFCEEMHALSKIKNDTTFNADDKIITLSTCTNVGNGRYALHAKLVKVER